MRKVINMIVLLLVSVLPMVSFAQGTSKTEKKMKTDKKVLVVFFSHTGENYAVGNIKKGNTHIVAEMIADKTGGTLFEIVPEKEYPKTYKGCVDIAKEEKESGARPAIKGDVTVESYDVIFIGYPNWWGDMPMILYTFFDTYDFSGKTIIPFNTHGGSGFSNTINTIAELEPNATIYEDGFTVSRNNVQEAEPDILAWLNELGYSN